MKKIVFSLIKRIAKIGFYYIIALLLFLFIFFIFFTISTGNIVAMITYPYVLVTLLLYFIVGSWPLPLFAIIIPEKYKQNMFIRIPLLVLAVLLGWASVVGFTLRVARGMD